MPPNYFYTEKKRAVKSGGDTVSYGLGSFFLLKGNKTRELWRWVEPAEEGGWDAARGGDGTQAGESAVSGLQFAVRPNPIAAGLATLRVQGYK